MANYTKVKDSGSGCVYGLAFLGALIYFISTAETLTDGLWGIIQAILWPAFLVYELFMYLGV